MTRKSAAAAHKASKPTAKRKKAGRSHEYRVDRAVEEISFATGRSVLGAIIVASSEKGVVAIMRRKDPDQLVDDLQRRFPNAHLVNGGREDQALVRRVVEYVANPRLGLDLTLDMRGTAFQKRVWKAVQEMPVGKTSTYTEVARKIGSPKAIRAVGNACATCNLGFAIPCHRVLRSDGSFHGRDLDCDEQRRLVEHEAGRMGSANGTAVK